MSIPPIQPTGQPSELPGGVRFATASATLSLPSTRDRCPSGGSWAVHQNPAQISHLFEQLQQPVQTLAQLANRQPPVMSQNEIDVVKDLNMQVELTQMDIQEISPSSIAAIQGSATTLFACLLPRLPGILSRIRPYLQAINYLSALSEAFQLHLKSKSKDSDHIAARMQAPMKELEQLSSSGNLDLSAIGFGLRIDDHLQHTNQNSRPRHTRNSLCNFIRIFKL